MKLARLTQPHVLEMVELHAEALANDLLPSLGPRFLSILHSEFIHSPYTFVLGNVENKRLRGFVVGTRSTSKFMQFTLLRNIHQILPIVIYRCLTRPVLIKYLLQTLTYGKKINVPQAEVLIIVVGKPWRSQGIGTQLFKGLTQEFKSARIKSFVVGTHANSPASNNFYVKLGGRLNHQSRLYDRLWNYYIFKITS